MHRQKHIADFLNLTGNEGQDKTYTQKECRKYQIYKLLIFHLYSSLLCTQQCLDRK